MLKPQLVPTLILCASVIALAAAVWMVWVDRHPDSPGPETHSEAVARIRGRTFYLDVAASPTAREIGLAHTDSLPEDRGLLFLYDTPGYYQFWMKGMAFPIDIVFIRDSTIVSIARNVQHPTGDDDLPLYTPDEPADMVLEVNAGLCDRYGIQEGDTVEISLPGTPTPHGS